MEYKDFFITETARVRDAMKKMDVLSEKILFVTEDQRLRGALTDGDIRRHLLRGGSLEDPVRTAANKNPRYAHNREEARSLYHRKNFIAIPIVGGDLTVVDVYTGEESKPHAAYNLQIPVVINAGGKGTRLYPYTKILPKPLIPVGELPILEHIMRQYQQFGCDSFHIIVNYKKELLKAFFSENENHYHISWYDEEKPLGTGGGLSLLKDSIHSTFFFANCDTLVQANYDSMIRFHREQGNAVTMICAYKNLQIPYGIVEMGQDGSILKLKEKPEFSFLTNTGMYIVEPEVLQDIRPDQPVGFPDIVLQQKEKGRKVAAYPISENEWLDMGQLPELEKMRIRLYGE